MSDRWQPEPRARVVNVNIMPIAIDTFLIQFSTPFRHLYIWSRRFFGNILASISIIFDTIFDLFSASLHVESSIFRMHFDVDFDFFTRFSIPFRFDIFLIRFSTPFLHLYIWSRRFFGCIFASISTHFFDMSLDSFSALLHMESSIFRKYFASISTLFDTIFKNVRTSQLAYSADATSPQH